MVLDMAKPICGARHGEVYVMLAMINLYMVLAMINLYMVLSAVKLV